MAAFRKQVAHLLGIDVVQENVEDHEARSVASDFKICRGALVKMYVPLRQFCRRGNRGLLVIAPDHPAVEMPFRIQGFDVSQEPYAERRIARSTMSTYYAAERMLKFKVITYG